MTILNGRIVGVDDSEFELRTGNGDEEPAGGKIRTASPEAVARFKAFLAAQPEKPKLKAVVRSPGIDPDARRQANEMAVRIRAKKLAEMNEQTATAVKPEKPKEQEEMSILSDEVVLTNDVLMACHARYMAGVESLRLIAADVNVTWQSLQAMFKAAGLSKRDGQPFGEFNGGKPKKIKGKAVVVETAVVPEPAMEPVKETAVTPANGAALTETEIEDQLRAIQQLMSMIGKVENVRISGTMRIDLHAEVVF